MRRNRRKQNHWRTVLTFILAGIVVVYVGYQGFRSIFSEYETEMARHHSVYESIDTQGIIIRAETLVKNSDEGHPYFMIENGTRVANDNKIAAVYHDVNNGRIEQEITEIKDQIATLKSIRSDASSNRLMLGDQTQEALYQLIRDTENGNLQELSSTQFHLLSLLSKEQLIVGKSVDLDAKIKELEDRKKELESVKKAPIEYIKAPDAGYFVDTTDGFEKDEKELLDLDKDGSITDDELLNAEEVLKKMSTGSLRELMNKKPTAVSGYCGKVVKAHQWYMMCVLSDRYYGELTKSIDQAGKIFLRMPFVLDDEIPTTVVSCTKDGSGNMAVLFKCNYMSEELSSIRLESVQVQMQKHEGLKVPKKAIVVDENQQAGVYVRVGNVATFRKIKQIYSEPADYVICEEIPGDTEYLQMYDDVITEGRGLYDGKIVG